MDGVSEHQGARWMKACRSTDSPVLDECLGSSPYACEVARSHVTSREQVAHERGDVAGKETLCHLTHHGMLDVSFGDEGAIDELTIFLRRAGCGGVGVARRSLLQSSARAFARRRAAPRSELLSARLDPRAGGGPQFGDRLVVGDRSLNPLVPGSRYLIPGSWFLVPELHV